MTSNLELVLSIAGCVIVYKKFLCSSTFLTYSDIQFLVTLWGFVVITVWSPEIILNVVSLSLSHKHQDSFFRSSFSCKRMGSSTALQPCFQLAWTTWCTDRLARCLGLRGCKKHLSSTLVFALPTPSFSHFTSDLLQPSTGESQCLQVLLRSGAGVGVSLLPSPPSLAMPHFPLLKRAPLPAAFPSHSNMAVLTRKWQGLAHEDVPLSETSWELLVNKMQMKYANSRFFCKTAKEISFMFLFNWS